MESFLSQDRKREIAEAFERWYRSQRKKEEAMGRLGKKANIAHAFRNGKLVPQPGALAILYEETGDEAFLFTAAEKDRLRKDTRTRNWPDEKVWTDRDGKNDLSARKTRVDRMAESIVMLSNEIKWLASLAEDDEVRRYAQKALVGSATRIFRSMMNLKLDVPKEFADLLRQLDTIVHLTGRNQ